MRKTYHLLKYTVQPVGAEMTLSVVGRIRILRDSGDQAILFLSHSEQRPQWDSLHRNISGCQDIR